VRAPRSPVGDVCVPIRDDSDIVAARSAGRSVAEQRGFGGSDLTMIATAISELARNILKYAHEGEIVIEPVERNSKAGVAVVARDDGPGIADVSLAMRDDRNRDQVAAAVGTSELAEWGVSARAIPGERVSGDRHVAAPLPAWALFAVVDGLGHGSHAARAAAEATRVLEARPGAHPEELIRRCHDALRRTRGAAITIACIDASAGEVIWLGVGNVQAVLLQPERPDVLPTLRPSRAPLQRGDVLVFATDGVRPVFGEWPAPSEAPAEIAARILAEQARGTDDALVLVVRYRGGRPANSA
jgi:negative regulator of sigma-B (phosphoserine phosphatase)